MAERLTILPEFQGGKAHETQANHRLGGHK